MNVGLGPFELLFILGSLSLLLLWPIALIDCLTNESSEGNTKVVWVIVILLAPCFGAAAYLLIRRPQRKRELGR